MSWVQVESRLPRPFTRVWVVTDTGRQTTAYVKSDRTWFITCSAIRKTGAIVREWRE